MTFLRSSACLRSAACVLLPVLPLLMLGACGTLRPAAVPHPAFYSLDTAAPRQQTAARPDAQTLIINPPHAASGFDSSRIIFAREPHKIEYFSQSEWVDPPARMLAPLLAAAMESSGAFRAVVQTPSAARADFRLDTEIIRLQHEFGGSPGSGTGSASGASRVRFTLRAYFVDERTRQVLASREFETVVASASEDAYGGVVAANRAVRTVLDSLSVFCAETARNPGPPMNR